MTDLRKAAEMALESLENLTTYDFKPSSIFKYFYPTAKGDYVDLREFKEKTKPAITALRQVLAQPEPSANMFWNINNPESGPFDCIYAAVEDEFNNGDLQIGDTLRFMQAVALPNVEVKITSVYQDDFEFKLMTGEQA